MLEPKEIIILNVITAFNMDLNTFRSGRPLSSSGGLRMKEPLKLEGRFVIPQSGALAYFNLNWRALLFL